MVEIKAADSEVRCFFTWRMKGHNRFYGSVWKTPMGLEGSGAFRRPGSIVRVLRTERWVRPTERAGSEGSFICRCLGQRKPLQPPCGRGNAIPLWWLAPPPCPVGSMSLDSRVAGLPYESSSFATPTSRGHYKAPLCCERLMKGMLHGVLFCPLNRGKSGAARIGGWHIGGCPLQRTGD